MIRERLLKQISNMEALIATQEEKYNLTTTCLAQTQAAIAASKIVSRVNGEPLTPTEMIAFDNALRNSVDGVTQALGGLGAMRRELQALKDELIMLPE